MRIRRGEKTGEATLQAIGIGHADTSISRRVTIQGWHIIAGREHFSSLCVPQPSPSISTPSGSAFSSSSPDPTFNEKKNMENAFKAYAGSTSQWSSSQLQSFDTLYNVPASTQIYCLKTPQYYVALYLYSEPNGGGVPTTMNFGPGHAMSQRINVESFQSWKVIVNRWHA